MPTAALSEPSDDEIVRRVVAGEHALFALIVRRHNTRLYRAVRSILRDEVEVEDVMQQAYVQAYDCLHQWNGSASFATWLARIAVHEAIARGKARRRFVPLDEIPEPASAVTPEDAATGRELVAHVERAIDEMPEILASVFVLREVEGLSTSETAGVLELSEEAVKVRLHRARAYLRRGAPDAFAFHRGRCDRMVERVGEAIT